MFVAASVASPPVVIAQSSSRPVLVAIFAHPDDEIAVGPLLARYAREGADVRLVLATSGDKGTRITNIPSRVPAGAHGGRARQSVRPHADPGSLPDRSRAV
ncbi:MAG: PIG-L family deacetylase [Acidobacteria bacterium]|nr:PIG-L family deacetylase [Acidobacteriota bacterium]